MQIYLEWSVIMRPGVLATTESRLLNHVGRKKWGTLDALHAHNGYHMLRSLLNLSVRMLKSNGPLFAKDKRNWNWIAMNNAIELQVSVAWKIITDISYVFNSQELWHLTSGKAHGDSEFLVKFLAWILQFLNAGESSCDLIIYNFSDNIARYFGRLYMKIQYINQK